MLLIILYHLLNPRQNQLQAELKRTIGPHQLEQAVIEHPPEQARFRLTHGGQKADHLLTGSTPCSLRIVETLR